jgi:hypothetical protein
MPPITLSFPPFSLSPLSFTSLDAPFSFPVILFDFFT